MSNVNREVVCGEALISLKGLTSVLEQKFEAQQTMRLQYEKLETYLVYLESNTVSKTLVHYLTWHISCLLFLQCEQKSFLHTDAETINGKLVSQASQQSISAHELQSTELCRLLVEYKSVLGSYFTKAIDEVCIEDSKISNLKEKISCFIKLGEEKLRSNSHWKLCQKEDSSSSFVIIKGDPMMGIEHTVMVLGTGIYSEDKIKLFSKLDMESQLNQGAIPDPEGEFGRTMEGIKCMLKEKEMKAKREYDCEVQDAETKRRLVLGQIHQERQAMTNAYPTDHKKAPLKRSSTMKRSIASAFSSATRCHDTGVVVKEEESQEWDKDPEFLKLIFVDHEDDNTKMLRLTSTSWHKSKPAAGIAEFELPSASGTSASGTSASDTSASGTSSGTMLESSKLALPVKHDKNDDEAEWIE